MATLKVDDLDGGDAAYTVRFLWDSKVYEIDLSEENYQKYLQALKPYVEKGRLSATGLLHTDRRTGAYVAHTPNNKLGHHPHKIQHSARTIRKWAKSQGYDIGERGIISDRILAEYSQYQQARVQSMTAAGKSESEALETLEASDVELDDDYDDDDFDDADDYEGEDGEDSEPENDDENDPENVWNSFKRLAE